VGTGVRSRGGDVSKWGDVSWAKKLRSQSAHATPRPGRQGHLKVGGIALGEFDAHN